MRARSLALLVLLALVSYTALLRPANSSPGPGVDNPSNQWAPYGPRVDGLQLNYYSSETVEFTEFELGLLDLTDWQVPTSKYNSYDSNPDFVLSEGQGQFGMFGIDFNYASSTWASWGCDWQHGISPCGIEIREAFAHLLDRPRFVTDGVLQGAGQALSDPSPPVKDPSASLPTTQNSWDTLSGQTTAGILHPATTSAFNIAPDAGGFAGAASLDICAARNHLIAANIGLQDNDMNCAIDGSSPGMANILSHPIRFMIRSDDQNRNSLGTGLLAAINQLFGASVINPTFSNIAQLRPIVFVSAPDGATDDWDVYTMGFSLLGPFPDHLTALYASLSASDQCGGNQNPLTFNYGFVCISSFDTYANAAAQTVDINAFRANTLSAFDELGKHAVNIPVYSLGIRLAALRSVAGLVNLRGASYPNFWTLLNARRDDSYTPVNSLYQFGGGSNFLRWGQRQGTTQLNIFNAATLWEFNVIGQLYDTLFASSPVDPANVFCWMCNSYTAYVDAQGDTHFLVDLRQNLRWHDGATVDAYDVKFTILNIRDVPAPAITGNVQLVRGVTVVRLNLVDIEMQGQSLSHLPNLAAVPIIPRHLWELPGDSTYGDVGRADPAKTGEGYDPLVQSTLIGSGPFVCRSVFPSDLGRVGTGCARNSDGSRAGQAVGPGGTMLLQKYDLTAEPGNTDPFVQYMRSYNPAWGTGSGPTAQSGQFQEFSWADRFDNATVTIRDLAAVAACFGKSSPAGCVDYNYWLRPAFHPATPTVVGAEVTIVASHLDETWVSPFSWSGDQSKQPGQTLRNIVPFTP